MQKLLKRQQGFTLVELLVVIAIIAILAVIGLTVFTGLQRGARDAQRRADIEAITRALEANYNTSTAQYSQLFTSNFAGNRIPQDPLNGQNSCGSSSTACAYCINTVTGGAANPTGALVTVSGGNATCNAGGATVQAVITNTTFPAIGNATGWIVCANLETGGGNVGVGGTTYCQGNQR